MATFILIHGAWHGGWCWRKLTPLLREAGHEVYTPTLTGLGERLHLCTATTDLRTHIQDVVGLLEYEELYSVVLVGHSYGGMVAAGVAARLPERIAHLVYLDAFVPRDDQSLLDLLPPPVAAGIQKQALRDGDGVHVPATSGDMYGIADESDIDWVRSKVTPQPLDTFTQPVHLGPQFHDTIDGTYILCQPANLFAQFAAQMRELPNWRYRELHTGHDAMITAPRDLAALLIEAGTLP